MSISESIDGMMLTVGMTMAFTSDSVSKKDVFRWYNRCVVRIARNSLARIMAEFATSQQCKRLLGPSGISRRVKQGAVDQGEGLSDVEVAN